MLSDSAKSPSSVSNKNIDITKMSDSVAARFRNQLDTSRWVPTDSDLITIASLVRRTANGAKPNTNATHQHQHGGKNCTSPSTTDDGKGGDAAHDVATEAAAAASLAKEMIARIESCVDVDAVVKQQHIRNSTVKRDAACDFIHACFPDRARLCDVCYDPILRPTMCCSQSGGEHFRKVTCEHEYCHGCLEQWVTSNVEQQLHQIRCVRVSYSNCAMDAPVIDDYNLHHPTSLVVIMADVIVLTNLHLQLVLPTHLSTSLHQGVLTTGASSSSTPMM